MSRGRILWLLLGSVILVGALFLFLVPGRTYLGQRRSLTAAQTRVRVLTTANAKLDQQIQQLQTDAEIERLAREQYGLVKPGEEAYAILPPKQSPRPPTPPAPARKPHHPWWEFWR
ncbi:MAG TPA: septum formation initiator family protein [Acidimicrobiales bacterium]|nr:septum formation initiator family protein [Acidimicrobiales bacterium]